MGLFRIISLKILPRFKILTVYLIYCNAVEGSEFLPLCLKLRCTVLLDDGVEELGVGVGVDRDGDGVRGAEVAGIPGGGADISLPDSHPLSCNKT